MLIGDTDITAGVEAPPLRFDLRNRGDLAEAGDINVCAIGEFGRHQVCAVVLVFWCFATIEPRNVCQKLKLLWGKLAVCPAEFLIDVAGINEQHFIASIGVPFGVVEKPEGAG